MTTFTEFILIKAFKIWPGETIINPDLQLLKLSVESAIIPYIDQSTQESLRQAFIMLLLHPRAWRRNSDGLAMFLVPKEWADIKHKSIS